MRQLIVVGADAERRSDDVLPAVAALALATRSRVLVLHVHNTAHHPRIPAEVRAVAARAAWHLERFAVDAQAETVVVNGAHVAQEIVDVAGRHGARMIALGSHGHSSMAAVFLGSVSHGVLARADCQVLIAPPGAARGAKEPAEISKILLAVDASPESRAAVLASTALAPLLRARVKVLHVRNAVFGNGDLSYVEIEEEARTMARQAAYQLREAGIRADWTIPAGINAVAEQIADAADDWEADLILVGSRRRRDLASALAGSVVHRLGHLVRRPILVAERPARKVPSAERKTTRLVRLPAPVGA
jgi:nucleotide-binding universal stress UspA family protein